MPNRPIVAVTRCIPDAGLELLSEHFELRVHDGELPPTLDELHALADGAVGMLTLLTDRIDAAFLDAHPSVRAISNYAVGYDNIDIGAATARGIPIGNTPDVLTQATAEMAFALIMAAARRIPEGIDYVRNGQWQTWGPRILLGCGLTGATLGIVGYGRIGAAVARMASGFDMRILATSRSTHHVAGVEFVSLDELLANSDIVSLHVALTDETHHLIGPAQLARMKPTAILVNTSRGPVVDTNALVDVLKRRAILGAAVDVTDPEPLSADHPLVSLANCIVVPHIASATVQTRDAMAVIAAENLIAFLTGGTPRSQVTR